MFIRECPLHACLSWATHPDTSRWRMPLRSRTRAGWAIPTSSAVSLAAPDPSLCLICGSRLCRNGRPRGGALTVGGAGAPFCARYLGLPGCLMWLPVAGQHGISNFDNGKADRRVYCRSKIELYFILDACHASVTAELIGSPRLISSLFAYRQRRATLCRSLFTGFASLKLFGLNPEYYWTSLTI